MRLLKISEEETLTDLHHFIHFSSDQIQLTSDKHQEHSEDVSSVCLCEHCVQIRRALVLCLPHTLLQACKSLQVELLFFTSVRANTIQRASNTCLKLGHNSLFQQWDRELHVITSPRLTGRLQRLRMSRMCRMCTMATTAGIYFVLSDYCRLVSTHLCCCVHDSAHAFCTCVFSYPPCCLLHRSHWSSHIFSTGRAVDHRGSPQQPPHHVLSTCGASVGRKKRKESTCGQPPEVNDPRVQRSPQRSSRGQYMLSDVTSSLQDR